MLLFLVAFSMIVQNKTRLVELVVLSQATLAINGYCSNYFHHQSLVFRMGATMNIPNFFFSCVFFAGRLVSIGTGTTLEHFYCTSV